MLALLIVGSATLLFSCGSRHNGVEYDNETLMTELSENRTIIMSENGVLSYIFTAPLIEGYSLAQNPYQEFRKGVKMITYTSDSLSLQNATLTANYAIYYDKQKLWEAKGNVVIIKKNRKGADTTVTSLTEVYTQQLFWDARTKKIYSNVDTKVLQPDGWHYGVGFEADEDLKNIHFRKYKSEMEFDFSPVEEQPDNTKDADKDAKEAAKGAAKGAAEGAAKDAKGVTGAGKTTTKSGVSSSSKTSKSSGRPDPRTPSRNREFNPSTMSTSQTPPSSGSLSPSSKITNSRLSTSTLTDGHALQQSQTPKEGPKSATQRTGKLEVSISNAK